MGCAHAFKILGTPTAESLTYCSVAVLDRYCVNSLPRKEAASPLVVGDAGLESIENWVVETFVKCLFPESCTT
jgi:hypothetical protein